MLKNVHLPIPTILYEVYHVASVHLLLESHTFQANTLECLSETPGKTTRGTSLCCLLSYTLPVGPSAHKSLLGWLLHLLTI